MNKEGDRKLSGFQELWGEKMVQREKVVDSIVEGFRLFGFKPQVLPSLYLAESLGKESGVEEKMIYHFRDHGDRHIGLRFDHTVPLRDFVERNFSSLPFPYKRYEVGNVWRADRPGKGRYREFSQMDVDIVGDSSIQSDIEIATFIPTVMQRIGIDTTVRVNSRQILAGLAEAGGVAEKDRQLTLFRVIDKFEKIGLKGVNNELQKSGFSDNLLKLVETYLEISGSDQEVISKLDSIIGNSNSGKNGLSRLQEIMKIIRGSRYSDKQFVLDPSIARGLDYYTGIIIETRFNPDPTYGSICSGGRYDNFIRNPSSGYIPTIGVSIGIDRLIAAMESTNLLPQVVNNTKVAIINFEMEMFPEYLRIANSLRELGIATEVYQHNKKIRDQFGLVNKNHIPFAISYGADEAKKGILRIKNMDTSIEEIVNLNDLPKIREKIITK